ncbi:MAG TPA: hypothetical protein V6C97_26030 [Oculatellaceae cyanobacterium]
MSHDKAVRNEKECLNSTDSVGSGSGRGSSNVDIIGLLKEYKTNTSGAACIADPNDGYIHCGPIVGTPAPITKPDFPPIRDPDQIKPNHPDPGFLKPSEPLQSTPRPIEVPLYQNR